mgnify:CR=1 FL=1
MWGGGGAEREGAVYGFMKHQAPWRIHTRLSVECQNYCDWETVGLMHSFKKSRQPGPIARLLSCTQEERKTYRGMDLAPTFEVPSMSRHPKTGDWFVSPSLSSLFNSFRSLSLSLAFPIMVCIILFLQFGCNQCFKTYQYAKV